MNPPTSALPDGSRFEERYEILGELGAGGSGRVYRARQLSTGQSVAIKLLSPRQVGDGSRGRETERFRREMRICADLSHPNIVGLIDSGETREGLLYAVFAHVPGETLEAVLSRDGAVGVREALRLMTQVLEALECAHARGIVHRDLKPSNLMLSGRAPRRSAVVLDFGLGGLADGRRRREWQILTQTREFLGTPLYASPEQLAGEAATERSDLYAWGVVFLECLTGQQPFAGAAAQRLLSGGGAVEIPGWLRGHRLGELLDKATAREPEKRELPAEALLETLEEIARGELPEAPAPVPRAAPLSEQGEQRQLTVLFCDLVGSSALSQRLGAQAYRYVVAAYHAQAAQAVERYEGYVAQSPGDGLLVYFGHPRAHENDADRAVRSGQEILRGLETLNARLEQQLAARLQVRVGIHTGPVVVGEVGGSDSQETLALGDTPNIAAWLEAFAEPDTVVISDATLRLVAGLFVTEELGTPELEGIAEPIRVHRVLQPSGVVSRLERAPRLTPFVGREQELGLLRQRFEEAREGRGQAVWIAGEAGIGKSRLVHRLGEGLREAQTPYGWLECRSSPYATGSALHPVIEAVEQGLGLEDAGREPEARLERLEQGLALAGLELERTAPLLASLLSLRLPANRYATLEMSPQLRRQRTLETLLAWVLALAGKQPLVLVVEDLHWADPSTLEWLGLLIEQCATARILLLLTHRPDFQPPWPARGHVLPIALSRLGPRQARQLAAQATDADLPAELVERLAAHSDGIPLFAEELAKAVVESGEPLDGSLSGLAIPETLQDSLMARLDHLGEAKTVAQVAAAIGRESPYALLEAVAPLPELELREGLGRLLDAEIIYQRGLPPKATYTFKHALVQDRAYQSLLTSQSRELHERIADAFAGRFPERVEHEPELMARHCEAAGRIDQAIDHYRRAGERASRRSANEEATLHLGRALELLRTLPADPERARSELPLQLALGVAFQASRGFGAPEVERAYLRARALCEQVEDLEQVAPALFGLSFHHASRPDFDAAGELADELLERAGRAGDPALELQGHHAVWIARFFGGGLDGARAHAERGLEIYRPEEHYRQTFRYGNHDPGVCAHMFRAWSLLLQGHPERARQGSLAALELARELEHPMTVAMALRNSAFVENELGHAEAAAAYVEELMGLSAELGFPLFAALGAAEQGRALAGRGEFRAGLDALARGEAVTRSVATGLFWPLCLALLLAGYLRAGRAAEGLAALARARSTLGALPTHVYQPELERLEGELWLLESGADAAASRSEARFRSAIEGARRQGARWLELRAATSLARLWQEQGRRDDARALLAPVHDWFSEGFASPDLLETKALMDELS